MPRHLDPGRPCACTSGLTYAECCRPFLRGEQEPPTALQLMRSRFTAFALGEVEYLWKTLAPSHPDRARPKADVERELRRACKRFEYRSLEILDAAETGVAFRAHLFERGVEHTFVERSQFVHDGTGWRYASGEVTHG